MSESIRAESKFDLFALSGSRLDWVTKKDAIHGIASGQISRAWRSRRTTTILSWGHCRVSAWTRRSRCRMMMPRACTLMCLRRRNSKSRKRGGVSDCCSKILAATLHCGSTRHVAHCSTLSGLYPRDRSICSYEVVHWNPDLVGA